MSNTANVNVTIQEARNLMRGHLKKGTKCLCCGQHAQVYTRSITSSMVYGLGLLYNHVKDTPFPSEEYVHLENFLKPLAIPSSIRADLPKLRFWELIEPLKGRPKEDGNPKNGKYRITELGIKFITGKCLVSKAVKIYNNTFYGFKGAEIDVHVAINNKFNYFELIRPRKNILYDLYVSGKIKL